MLKTCFRTETLSLSLTPDPFFSLILSSSLLLLAKNPPVRSLAVFLSSPAFLAGFPLLLCTGIRRPSPTRKSGLQLTRHQPADYPPSGVAFPQFSRASWQGAHCLTCCNPGWGKGKKKKREELLPPCRRCHAFRCLSYFVRSTLLPPSRVA